MHNKASRVLQIELQVVAPSKRHNGQTGLKFRPTWGEKKTEEENRTKLQTFIIVIWGTWTVVEVHQTPH